MVLTVESETVTYLLSVSASRGPVFSAISLNRADRLEQNMEKGVSIRDMIFRDTLIKNQYFKVQFNGYIAIAS